MAKKKKNTAKKKAHKKDSSKKSKSELKLRRKLIKTILDTSVSESEKVATTPAVKKPKKLKKVKPVKVSATPKLKKPKKIKPPKRHKGALHAVEHVRELARDASRKKWLDDAQGADDLSKEESEAILEALEALAKKTEKPHR